MNHWECYEKLYGKELMEITYLDFYNKGFYHACKKVEFTVSVREKDKDEMLQELVRIIPPAGEIQLPTGTFSVTKPLHLRGRGVNKTIIKGA